MLSADREIATHEEESKKENWRLVRQAAQTVHNVQNQFNTLLKKISLVVEVEKDLQLDDKATAS